MGGGRFPMAAVSDLRLIGSWRESLPLKRLSIKISFYDKAKVENMIQCVPPQISFKEYNNISLHRLKVGNGKWMTFELEQILIIKCGACLVHKKV
jgi:hypothetical protein